MAVSQLIGARVQRREDPRLITGRGHFIEDHVLPGLAHMAVVRSPHPHARIVGIDKAAAQSLPGVLAVLTAQDFKAQISGGMPVTPAFAPEKKYVPERFPIAESEVCFQGEPVAVVVATSRALAADAADLVQVEYEPLPAVVDPEAAMVAGSFKAHSDGPDNIGWDMTFAGGDIDAAFAKAEIRVSERILQQRLAPTAIEPRGVMADYSPYDERLTLWLSSQNPHFIRLFVSGAMGLPESHVRVVSPDVGGGFGSKISPYPEDYLVPAASRILSRPVRWIETRTESVMTTIHGRGQVFTAEAAALRDGTLLGLRLTQVLDLGAYHGTFGAFQACACLMSGGVYRWEAISARTVGVLTNKVPTDPYRGAGRPEGTHLCERMVDRVAQELGMDPADLRRKNFAQEFPYVNNFGLTYDSGNYDGTLDRALELVDYPGWRQRQAKAREEGRLIGVGLSTWVEICGFGPSQPTAAATGGIGLVEAAEIRFLPSGSVAAYVGTHAHGQGHDTTFSQIVADTLGVPLAAIEVHHGDTAEGPAFGYGTYGSRSLAVGGMALHQAATVVREKARQLAAHLLEASPDDLDFAQGTFSVRGNPAAHKTVQEVALAAYGGSLPEGMEHGLEAVSYFDPPNFVWPFGAHICVVEVDRDTGAVAIQKYVAVDDCGNVINPMIVEGQLHGGIAQGISQALYEEVVYDQESGQLVTGTMVDYLIPTMNELPVPTLDRTVTPSPTNALGVKGIGEAGTIASSAAVINAICDALSPLGIHHVDMPATPERIWRMIQEAAR
ncbi:MAG: molybdopterin-dependent oxidoreductase [Candidatus Dormibacteraeota bacterium]|nr:molybdopterin-dependent oxidoreductase [Candidatus Dormibacteraeota bacterium]